MPTLRLTEFAHTSDIFDDLFILEESAIAWQEKVAETDDETLKGIFNSLSEQEKTYSILDCLKHLVKVVKELIIPSPCNKQ